LNNTTRDNRAQEAFDQALKIADAYPSNEFDTSNMQKDYIKSYKIKDWLALAK